MSPTTISGSTTPTPACRPTAGWPNVMPLPPAPQPIPPAGATRFVSRTARSTWRPSPSTSSATSSSEITSDWRPPAMISWPPSPNPTTRTSPAFSRAELGPQAQPIRRSTASAAIRARRHAALLGLTAAGPQTAVVASAPVAFIVKEEAISCVSTDLPRRRVLCRGPPGAAGARRERGRIPRRANRAAGIALVGWLGRGSPFE